MAHCNSSQDVSSLASRSTQLVAGIRSNPSFRLPADRKKPVILIAGGCGIAPIRAFIEERMYFANKSGRASLGEAYVFLGFRNPADAVFSDMIGESIEMGALSGQYTTYQFGSEADSPKMVSDSIRDQSQLIYDMLVKNDGYIYVCGGARVFGVAIENALYDVLLRHGGGDDGQFKDVASATDYMRLLSHEGRLNEDLAD